MFVSYDDNNIIINLKTLYKYVDIFDEEYEQKYEMFSTPLYRKYQIQLEMNQLSKTITNLINLLPKYSERANILSCLFGTIIERNK